MSEEQRSMPSTAGAALRGECKICVLLCLRFGLLWKFNVQIATCTAALEPKFSADVFAC